MKHFLNIFILIALLGFAGFSFAAKQQQIRRISSVEIATAAAQ